MKQTDEGIFLHRTVFSSSSLIATFYTRHQGLRKFVFKGGKKKAHQLYPMSLSELTFYGRPESDLQQLTEVQPSEHLEFQFDPVKATIAFFIAETVRKCVHEFDTDQNVFDFLKETVQSLNAADDEQVSVFPVRFLIDFSEMLGIQPLVEVGTGVFDLDEGVISMGAHPGHLTETGEHVALISKGISGEIPPVPRKLREQALSTLMKYYTIHVPGLKEFETYQIVKETLS